MGYRVLADGTIAADTLDEAIALQRRIRETDPAPAPKRPMGSGTVGLTKTGTFRIRLRTQDGGRINRGGFRSRGEAEAALAEVVVGGAAPPPRHRRRQRCSACLEPGHIARKCPRAARAAASNEPAKQERPPAEASAAAPIDDDSLPPDLALVEAAAVIDEPGDERAPAPATDPGDDAPPLRRAQHRCSRCGIPGHRASTCDIQPLTRDERRMAIEAWATRRRAPAPAGDPPPTPAPPPLVCRTFDADEDFSEFLPDEITEPPEPAGAVGAPLPPTPAPALPAPADHPQVIDPTRLLIRRNGLTKTVSADRPLTAAEIAAGADLETPPDVTRPITRGDCVDADRPCPFVSCSHHLFLDVDDDGALKLNFPHLDPDQLTETCALDVADRGGDTLVVVGQLLGDLSRERIRQIENIALGQLAEHADDLEAAPVRGSSAPEDAIT